MCGTVCGIVPAVVCTGVSTVCRHRVFSHYKGMVRILTHSNTITINLQVKGYSQSSLGSVPVPSNLHMMYERVWDEADYVVPPAENGAFFVTTNVVITPNQTWGECPEVINI